MTRGRRYSWYRDDPAAATPPSDPTPRSALFRLAAALAVREFTRPDPPYDNIKETSPMNPTDEEIQNVLRDAVADLTKGHAKHPPASVDGKEYCEQCLEDWPCPNLTVSHTLTDFANAFEPAPEKIEATGPYDECGERKLTLRDWREAMAS